MPIPLLVTDPTDVLAGHRIPPLHARKGVGQWKQKLMRLGAVFFLAWGLLHIAVGLGGAAVFFTEGPLGALSATDLAIASDEVRLALERALIGEAKALKALADGAIFTSSVRICST